MKKKWCLFATKKKDVKKRCKNFFYSCLIYHKWIHPSTKYINSVEASAKYYTASVKTCKTRIRPLRSHFSIPLGWHGRGEQVDLWNCRVLMQVKLQFFGFSSPESLPPSPSLSYFFFLYEKRTPDIFSKNLWNSKNFLLKAICYRPKL